MLTTGHEDSSPRWERPAAESDVETADTVHQVPVLMSPNAPADVLPPKAPRREPYWRRVTWQKMTLPTVIQGVAAALILVCVSVAAAVVIRGPRVPTVVKVGPSIVLTASAGSGTPTDGNSSAGTPMSTTPGIIKFGGGGDTSITQACNGIQPLGALALSLDNSKSTVPVDWWVNVTQLTPDGKYLWAVAKLPYGTVPAGKSTALLLIPASSICSSIAGGSAPVTFTADVDYGGVGGFRVTDVVFPGIGPAPTGTDTATPPGRGP